MSAPALWMARHPRPVVAPGLCYGRLDLAADAEDLRQVAAQMAACLPQGLQLRSSPARRCTALAEALLALRPDLQDRGVSGALAEMDFGNWEGRPWAELPAAELRAWTDDFSDYQPGGGESVRAFLGRVRQALCGALADAGRVGTDGAGRVGDPGSAGRPGRAGGMENRSAGRRGRLDSDTAGRIEADILRPELWITHAGVIRGVAWLLASAGASEGGAAVHPAWALLPASQVASMTKDASPSPTETQAHRRRGGRAEATPTETPAQSSLPKAAATPTSTLSSASATPVPTPSATPPLPRAGQQVAAAAAMPDSGQWPSFGIGYGELWAVVGV